MKYRALSFLLIVLAFLSSCTPKEPPRDLFFFYFESCAGCEDYEMAEDLAARIKKSAKKEWNASSYNLVLPEGGETLKDVLEDKSLPDISRSLPILIVEDEFVNGYEKIDETLTELGL